MACTDGYPTQDATSVGAMTPAEHVRMLNSYLDDTARGADLHLALDGPCALTVRDAGGARSATRSRMGLDDMQVRFDTEPVSGRYLVRVRGDATEARTFEVANWVSAVAFRSHLQQLQRGCETATRVG
jgi:hypothetical protein